MSAERVSFSSMLLLFAKPSRHSWFDVSGHYLSWLLLGIVSPLQARTGAPELLVLPGCIGLVLLTIALLRLHTGMHRLLPYA